MQFTHLDCDPNARLAGDTVCMPTLGIQFYFDSNPVFRTISLISAGPNQDWSGWDQFRKSLMDGLKTQSQTFAPKYVVGISFLLLGLAMLVALHAFIWYDSAAFLKAIPDFLRI